MLTLKPLCQRLRSSPIARNTFFASGWQVVRIGLQVCYLVAVARLLGAEGYGWFAGALALAASFSPLVGLGFGLILVKQVARQPASFPVYWARNIVAVLFSAPVLMVLVMALAYFLLPAPKRWQVIGLLLFSELLFAPLIVVCANAYQAHEKLGRSTFVHVMLNLFRLVGTLVLILVFGHVDVELFGWGYFIATLVAAVITLGLAIKKYGRPVWELRGMLGEVAEGMGFSASLVVGSTQAEFDKTLMLRLSSAENAGVYSAASRVISATTIPIVIFALAAVPRLFREGEKGLYAGGQLARRLLPPVMAYGVIAGLAIHACAPLIPLAIGNDFSASVDIIQLMAPLPLLSGVSLMLLGVLSCSGAQAWRVVIEGVLLGLNIGLNLILIPSLGAKGAVLSLLCSQVILAATLIAMLLYGPHKLIAKKKIVE